MKKDKNKDTKLLIGIIAAIVVLSIIAILVLIMFLPLEWGFGGFMASGIAIIPIKGEIVSSSSSFGSDLSSDEVVEMIGEAEENPSIGAIFLDIDSPGGEVVASKQIVYKIRSAEKPVYSYINSVGASGAYYIAAASDYIMADEDSITGSIGVISIILNFEELMEELGIGVNVLKEGEFKAIGSPFKELTEQEQELLQGILTQIFEGFKEDVLEFRKEKLTKSQLESVADGRILTGKQALQVNLVDELLTKEEAIDRVAELAGIEEPVLISYEKEKLSFFDLFVTSGKAFGEGFKSSLKSNELIQFR